MATQAILTFSDGKLSVPAEVQKELHLVDGMKFRVALASGRRLSSANDTQNVPSASKRDWRSFQGMLSDYPEHDTTRARAEERAWELEHDERKFGPFPER